LVEILPAVGYVEAIQENAPCRRIACHASFQLQRADPCEGV
jgi:hypothetical protein